MDAFFHEQPSAIEAQFNYTEFSLNHQPNLLKLTVTKTSPTATTVAVTSWQKIEVVIVQLGPISKTLIIC